MMFQSLVLCLALSGQTDVPDPMLIPDASTVPDASVVIDAGLTITVPKAPEHTMPAAPTDEQVPELVSTLLGAYEKGDWRLGLISILMLVMWALRKTLLSSIAENRTDLLPWITLAISMSGGCVLALKAGKPIGEVVINGALIGLAASGAWSLVGKHVIGILLKMFAKKPVDKPAEKPAEPEKK